MFNIFFLIMHLLNKVIFVVKSEELKCVLNEVSIDL